MSRHLLRLVTLALSTLALVATSAVVSVPAPATAAAPTVKVTRVVGGLKIPWDVTWVNGLMLFNQRAGGVWSKRGGAPAKRVSMPLPRIYANSEAGMLGMVADPGARINRMFYTCMAVARSNGSPLGVEVWKWRLRGDTRAERVRKVITGIPLSSGRHSGCRLRFRSAHILYIGTGDAVRGTNPQNLQSLGGKILRVRDDGRIPRDNPYYRRGGNARYVWTYGHRNVQGLIKRPGRSELWSVEQGTSRDDEINVVWAGRNYGWNPVPGYNEARPMTDLARFPRAVRARWRSGTPTVAACGGTFISGTRWGSWNGLLAVARLKGRGIGLYSVSRTNALTGQRVVFAGYGRVRTVQQGPDGALYFTTSNGSGDGVYKITPA
ncbi:MAG TPA: PQQ-dependent sugar dehydrogenase [Propionibacteriaceae bacterium]|nr:PQQ-dependent sugar dehydrogenase [Propionibacteriaceae bacterium]